MFTFFGLTCDLTIFHLNRFLQVLAVLYFQAEFIPLLFVYFGVLIYLLFTRCYFITIAYSVWYFYDLKARKRGGTRRRWLRKLSLWKYIRDYFPISLVKTTDLDPNKNYIFGIHPHGIFSFGAIINFATEANNVSEMFFGLTPYLLTLNERFFYPINRDFILAIGFRSVCKESIEYLLTKNGVGNIVGIVVGGAAEVFNAAPNTLILNLKNRKGFVKMAIKTGTSLVPVISFGENDVYNQHVGDDNCLLSRIQRKILLTTRAPIPLFYSKRVLKYFFGLLPFRKPIVTVVGEPLSVAKNESPSQQEIDQIHAEYLKSLEKLFLQNKDKYGFSDLKLVIN